MSKENGVVIPQVDAVAVHETTDGNIEISQQSGDHTEIQVIWLPKSMLRLLIEALQKMEAGGA